LIVTLFCSFTWAIPPEQLLEHLHSEDFEVRKAAEEELWAAALYSTPELRSLLIRELDNPDPYVRKVAVRTLSRCTSRPELGSQLIRMLDDSDPTVQSAAISALRYSDVWRTQAKKHLTKLLKIAQREADMPGRAATGLVAGLNEPKAIPFLEKVIQEGQDYKYEAILGVAKIGNPEAIAVLTKALSNQDPAIRAAVIRSLAQHNVKSAMADISKLKSDPDEKVRQAAIKALAAFGDNNVTKDVLSQLEASSPYSRTGAIEMLEQLKAKESIPALLNLTRTDADSSVRSRALSAVKTIAPDDPRLHSATLKLTEDKDNRVRLAAFDALQIQPITPEVIKALERGVTDPFVLVKKSAAKTIAAAPDLSKLPATMLSAAMDVPDMGMQREFARRLLKSDSAGVKLLVEKVVTTRDIDLKQWISALNTYDSAVQDDVFRATNPWLKNSDRSIRKEALTILEFSRTKNPLAVEGLAIAAQDSDREISRQAAFALQAIDTLEAKAAARESGANQTIRNTSAKWDAEIKQSVTEVIKMRQAEDLKPEKSEFEFHSLYESTKYQDGHEFAFTLSPDNRWLMFFANESPGDETNDNYFNPSVVVINTATKAKHILKTVDTVKDVIIGIDESSWSIESKFFLIADAYGKKPLLILDVSGSEPKLVEYKYLTANQKLEYRSVLDTLSCSDCYDRSREDSLFEQFIAKDDFYPAYQQPSFAYNIMSKDGTKLFFLKGRERKSEAKPALAFFDIPTKSEQVLYEFPSRPAVGGGNECVEIEKMRLSPDERYLYYHLEYGCGGFFSNRKTGSYILDLNSRTPYYVSPQIEHTVHWSSDSKKLFYLAWSREKKQSETLHKLGYIDLPE